MLRVPYVWRRIQIVNVKPSTKELSEKMKMKNRYALFGAAVVSAFIGVAAVVASAGEVNVYSYRKPKLIEVWTWMSQLLH